MPAKGLLPVIFVDGEPYVFIGRVGPHRIMLERLYGGLRDFRLRLGMSQKELAFALDVGQSYISKIESGQQSFSEPIRAKVEKLMRERLT